MGKIETTSRSGIQITFDNGVKVSIQFGETSWCANNPVKEEGLGICLLRSFVKPQDRFNVCLDAEVAIFSADGKYITDEYTEEKGVESFKDVVGWRTPEDIVDILMWARDYKATT